MSGIYISGMEMPKSCAWCPLASGCYCAATKEGQYIGSYQSQKIKPDFCPLVEVPPHGALKDMDDLDRAFTVLRFNEDGSLKHWGNRKDWCVRGAEVEMLFATAQTIIPADPEEGEA